ncbi:MAG: glycosyltransferase [Oligoflexia bacterium]|nr:glycosyltransferase [Oligoflexia bacterium]
MFTLPSLAVVIPTYNGERTVRHSIESVLNQTYRDFTLYVFNDGSKDGTSELLRSIARECGDPRLKVIDNPVNLGLSKTHQLALASLKEEWLAHLDHDDLMRPDRLEKQVAMIAANPRLVAVGSALQYIDGSGAPLGLRRYPVGAQEIRRRLPIENCVANPAALFHRPTALKVGGYRPGIDGVEDYDLWLRMAQVGDIENHPEPLTSYRIHPSQFTARNTRQQNRRSLRTRLEAVRLGYPAGPYYWLTWLAQAALLAFPGRFVIWLFNRRVLRAGRDQFRQLTS